MSSAARLVVKKIVMDQSYGKNSFYAMADGAVFEYDRDKCSVTDWFPLGMKSRKPKLIYDNVERRSRFGNKNNVLLFCLCSMGCQPTRLLKHQSISQLISLPLCLSVSPSLSLCLSLSLSLCLSLSLSRPDITILVEWA